MATAMVLNRRRIAPALAGLTRRLVVRGLPLVLLLLVLPAGAAQDDDAGAKALAEGDRLLRTGFPVLAIREYREALRAGAPAPVVSLRIAHAHCAAGEYDAADEQLEGVLTAEPEHVDALRLRARVRFWQGRYDASWEWFRRYLKLAPQDEDVRLEYALSLAWGKRFDDALVELGKLEASKTHGLEARFRHAEVLSWKQDYQKARAVLAEILAVKALPPEMRSRCLVLRGRMLAWERKFRDAEAEYRQAVEVDPRSVEAWLALGEVQEWQGKPTEARASYAKAVQVAPSDARARAALARLGGK